MIVKKSPAEIDRKLNELFTAGCKLAWVIDPRARSAKVLLSLDTDLLHARYRQKTVENILKKAVTPAGEPIVLNEPYSPALRQLSLSYTAHSGEASIGSASLSPRSCPARSPRNSSSRAPRTLRCSASSRPAPAGAGISQRCGLRRTPISRW